MSLYDYQMSGEIHRQGFDFHAVIMAAMRMADSQNLRLLQQAFPEVYKELETRLLSPGGRLKGE